MQTYIHTCEPKYILNGFVDQPLCLFRSSFFFGSFFGSFLALFLALFFGSFLALFLFYTPMGKGLARKDLSHVTLKVK